MPTTPQGLECYLRSYEPDVSPKEFDDWFDNVRAPARLATPGVKSGARYEASDGEKPEWLSMYELESAEITRGPEYSKLLESAPAHERSLILRQPVAQRRIYKLIMESVGKSSTLPGKHLLFITWQVQPDLEEDFIKWYKDEHMEDITKVPGWMRGRVYKFYDGADLVPREGPAFGNYSVIHDWTHGDYMSAPEFLSAIETPWSKKILGSVKMFKPRKYELQRAFQPLYAYT